jgi:sugar phosphate isomerase/epimerase
MNPIGHSSPSFCHDPIASTMARVARDGFAVWEVVAEGGHDPWVHRKEFQRHQPSYDLELQVHAPLSDANLGSLVPTFWDLSVRTVERALQGARAIGATRATLHPGNHTPLSRGHYPQLHERARRAVRRLDRTGRDLGLELCLENMPTGWAFETDSVAKLLDLTRGTEFKLCFDLGHAHVAKRLPEFVKAARRIGNVHVHDNRGDFDAHLTLDQGTLPWRATVDGLLRAGYRGRWIVESRRHASGKGSLRRLRDYLKARTR